MSEAKRIVEHISGNIVGWIEEPGTIAPAKPPADQLMVTIAVIDVGKGHTRLSERRRVGRHRPIAVGTRLSWCFP